MRSPAFRLLLVAVLISLLGVLSIYSSTFQKDGPIQDIYLRQLLWASIGIVLFFIFSGFNYRQFRDLIWPLYFIIVGLLVLVDVLGIIRLGAQRWLRFAWFNFQPSELAKLVMVIFMANYFTRRRADSLSSDARRLKLSQAVVIPMLFVAIPAALIVQQPDLGSGLLVLFVAGMIMYLSGVKMRYLLILLACFCLCLPVAWHFLHGYQKDRIMVFLNPNIDPLGAGYTIIQAKIAIGSSWLFGKGWLSGTQNQLHFLPESHTDFIFSTFTEEWGLLGSSFLVVLYFIIVWTGFRISEKTSDDFGKLLASGISAMFALQVGINIAMNLGLAPVVGIPLPLMSYGGSSIFVSFIALGILANISRTRAVF